MSSPSDSNRDPRLADVQAQIEEMEAQISNEETPDFRDAPEFRSVGPTEDNIQAINDTDGTTNFAINSARRLQPASNVGMEKNVLTPEDSGVEAETTNVGGNSVVLSSLLSLVVALLLLIAVRLILPPILESSRYSWMRGQLRAEFEASGEQLESVSLDGLSRVSQLVSKRAAPSVVHLTVRTRSSFFEDLQRQGFGDRIALQTDSQGSGVVVDASGYILTNEHVVRDADELLVRLSDGRLVPGEVLGVDELTDLAVVKVDTNNLFAIDWGDSEAVEVGSPVWALGSPFGLTGSITFGILSGKDRMNLSGTSYMDSSLNAQARYGNLMQSDVAVNPGNSGGPLVNARGELIGVNTAIVGESYRGVSFSIPSNVARRVFDSIRSGLPVPRGWLGISMAEVPIADSEDGSVTIMVRGFSDEDSPARKAGIQPGDELITIAGNPISSMKDVAQTVENLPPGSLQTIVVKRNNNVLELSVLIGQLPQQ